MAAAAAGGEHADCDTGKQMLHSGWIARGEVGDSLPLLLRRQRGDQPAAPPCDRPRGRHAAGQRRAAGDGCQTPSEVQ